MPRHAQEGGGAARRGEQAPRRQNEEVAIPPRMMSGAPLSDRREAKPIAAIVLLALGSVVAAYYVALFAAVTIAGLAPFCRFEPVGCSILLLLFGLTGATATVAGAAAAAIFLRPQRHRALGAAAVGVAVADIVSVSLIFPVTVWTVLLFLGGWSLACVVTGGVLAIFWKPPQRAPPHYAWPPALAREAAPPGDPPAGGPIRRPPSEPS